jgi:hypothetical protein
MEKPEKPGADAADLAAQALTRRDRTLLAEAAACARSAGQRQVVAVVAAYLDADHDRALLLAHDHLADHPDSPVVLRVLALLED